MPVLIDTSILVRIANALDPLGPVARSAVRTLRSGGEHLCVAPQNLIEFRNVATRPRAVNGLGFDVATAERQVADFELTFTLLDESSAIYPAWKSLVHSAGVIGKQVHDARLAAVCQVSGMTKVLTFNTGDFVRLVPFVTGLLVVDPASVW